MCLFVLTAFTICFIVCLFCPSHKVTGVCLSPEFTVLVAILLAFVQWPFFTPPVTNAVWSVFLLVQLSSLYSPPSMGVVG